MKVLEKKEHLRHEQDGPRHVFLPTLSREKARLSALARILRTFFDDSAEGAVAALIDLKAGKLTPEDYDRLVERIEAAKREGR